ncbi:MAG: hypothetical protein K9L22_10245 [Methylococcaceae bacterium]|nr:hypothetical protein [Methylococcaceae bacterium]
MIIDIYTSTKSGNKYISVPKGTKIAELKLPNSIDPDLLTLSPFKTRLEIDPKKNHSALDQNNIIQQIENNGYAVHEAKTVINIGTVK